MKILILTIILGVTSFSCEDERPRYPRKYNSSYRYKKYKYQRSSTYRYRPYRKYKTSKQLMEEQAAYERETKRLRNPRPRRHWKSYNRNRTGESQRVLFQKALNSGCRQGAVYTGCHKNGWKCHRINVHTKRLWNTVSLSVKVSQKMSQWLFPTSRNHFGGTTVLHLKSCNGIMNPSLPYNLCGRISASSCSSFPEFRI